MSQKSVVRREGRMGWLVGRFAFLPYASALFPFTPRPTPRERHRLDRRTGDSGGLAESEGGVEDTMPQALSHALVMETVDRSCRRTGRHWIPCCYPDYG